ncbi:hypothetical protein [Kitasatospora sp. NPDC057738]|uniref:hypothetical protein n=1 Tax=Kitasatospora sp. NPDC057738 TaxID=3346233 RepID=UPI0036B9B29A
MISLLAWIAVGTALYLVMAAALTSSGWGSSAKRIPGQFLARIPFLSRLPGTATRRQAERAITVLLEQGVTAPVLLDRTAVQKVVTRRALATWGLALVWAPLAIASLISFEVVMLATPASSANTRHHFSAAPFLPWLLLALTIVLAEADRRGAARSVPHQWTAHATVVAALSYANDAPERRGTSRDEAICEAVQTLSGAPHCCARPPTAPGRLITSYVAISRSRLH